MALNVSTLFRIRTIVEGGAGPRAVFGRGLLITLDNAIAAGGSGKVRLFERLADVQEVLSAGDGLDAATTWFSADPAPQGLFIGRWATADIDTTLAGGTPSAATAFTGTDYSFAIDGVNVSGINLSTPTTYAAIATAIQVALRTASGHSASSFTYANGVFLITLDDGAEITPGYLTAALTAGVQVGTDLVPLLAMGAGDAVYLQGHDEESITDAFAEMVSVASDAPVAVLLAPDAPLTDPVGTGSTREALAAAAQSGDYIFALLDTSAQALVAGDTTSEGALAFGRSQNQVAALYSTPGELADVGLLAEMSSQNLSNAASIITPHGKPIPGVLAVNIDGPEYAELKRKNMNVLATVGGLPTLLGGYTSSAGRWLDVEWWLLWLKSEMESALFSAQRNSRRLTSAILHDAGTRVLQQGVRNGGIRPGGEVSAATKADIIRTTGNHGFDGVLTTGYLLWVQRSSVRTQANRDNRIGTFKAWAAPSEAIHEVTGDIILIN